MTTTGVAPAGARRFRLRTASVLALCAAFAADVHAERDRAERDRAGDVFAGLAGEYRGAHKDEPLIVWVERVASLEQGRSAAALLVFKAEDREAVRERLDGFIRQPDVHYRKVCQRAERTEYGYVFPLFERLWNSGGGLARLHDGLHGKRLAPGWKKMKADKYGRYLANDEYIDLGNQQYMIKRIRRDPGSGALKSVRFTQTGYLQNFFDNPKVELTRVGEVPARGILRAYLRGKDEAREALGLGGAELSKEMPEVCGGKGE